MTKKSKLLMNNSVDPVTSLLREALFSNDLAVEISSTNNSVVKATSQEIASTSEHSSSNEENRRKKRRKSTPNLSLNTNMYLASDNDDDYLDFYADEQLPDEDLFRNDIDESNQDKIGLSENENHKNLNADEEDSLDEQRKWNLDEKINNLVKYNSKFVKYLDAKKFDFKYIQENGLEDPLVFLDKSGLGMRLPSENFRVSDVKSCVGSKRIVDVVDVNTQKGLTMSMKDWCEYYEAPKRERLLNVISLEFSHTKLENYVEAPLVVRQLDWIETAWPRQLREAHTESTNLIEKMKYPKVQKYVLMSVAGCYTDFHIDMGGTSVWYHVLKGEKIFWLIPPSEKNFKIYEKWIMSGNQSSSFLPDLVDDCQRVVLKQGTTFMLPSGWIHGVYTSKDSLVFGGNFLHSFNVQTQLKVYNLETKTKVPQQYRYPFFVEMMWFVIERYVHCLTGFTHMNDFDESFGLSDHYDRVAYKTFQPVKNSSLNKHEYEGLKCLYEFLVQLNGNKRQIPKEIVQPEVLIQSFKKLLEEYSMKFDSNCQSQLASGTPFMHWPKPEKKYLKKIENNLKRKEQEDEEEEDMTTNDLSQDLIEQSLLSANSSSTFSDQLSPNQLNQSQNQTRKHVMRNLPRTKGSIKKRLRPQNVPRSNVERRRRVRCHNCEPCTRDDCGDCKYCKDMKKFGGTGISKQCCLAKQCLQPLLPTTTTCMACEVLIDRFHQDKSNVMYECEICFEIYHVQCFRRQYEHLNHMEPIINEDLNNCWKCPNCVNKGYIKSDCLKQEVAKQMQFHEQSSGNSSLNNSFNSIITTVINNSASMKTRVNNGSNNNNNSNNNNIDFFLSPQSTNTSSTQNLIYKAIQPKPQPLSSVQILDLPKPKFKRHRRTKKEMEDSKLKIEVNNDYYLNSDSIQTIYDSNNTVFSNSNNNTQNSDGLKRRRRRTKLKIKMESLAPPSSHFVAKQMQDDDSIISIDSLTYYEKQIILREFCEICYDNNISGENNDEQKKTINNLILYQKTNGDFSSKNFTNNSANSDHDTILVDEEDEEEEEEGEEEVEEYELEEKGNQMNTNDTTSFRSISVNNNDSTSTQNSFSETIQTDEFNYDLDPNNEPIYYDDLEEDDLTCIQLNNRKKVK